VQISNEDPIEIKMDQAMMVAYGLVATLQLLRVNNSFNWVLLTKVGRYVRN
jgi:hypothetical protein